MASVRSEDFTFDSANLIKAVNKKDNKKAIVASTNAYLRQMAHQFIEQTIDTGGQGLSDLNTLQNLSPQEINQRITTLKTVASQITNAEQKSAIEAIIQTCEGEIGRRQAEKTKTE